MKKIAVLIFFGLMSVMPSMVSAGEDDNVYGWAWSSNIGWISFNCVTDDTCDDHDYGVDLDSSNNLVGYAWSPNIGWIKFGGLSGFPTGGGTQQQNANLNGLNLKGWVRAMAYDGDYDGWIALSGSGYSVDLNTDHFEGYAWGGEVLGWISFDAPGADGGVQLGDYVIPGFSVTGPSSLKIQFVGQNSADSESGSYFVDSGGTTYNLPVTISVDSITPSLPASTTILYSLDSGGSYSESPSAIISNYAQGVGFRARLNRSVATTTTYTMHLRGTGSDAKTSVKDIQLYPVLFDPIFEER